MIEFLQSNGTTIALIKDTNRLNTVNASGMKSAITEQFNRNGVRMVLDLQHVKFIDSTGIGVIISALKMAKLNQGHFALKNIQPEVMKLLALMKLDKILDIE